MSSRRCHNGSRMLPSRPQLTSHLDNFNLDNGRWIYDVIWTRELHVDYHVTPSSLGPPGSFSNVKRK